MKRTATQLLRFATIGAFATSVHYLALLALVEILSARPTFANGLAFCSSLAVSYHGQKRWVFKVDQVAIDVTARFVVIALMGFVGNIGIMAICHDLLRLDYRIGFAITVVTLPALTFVANKFWVFKHQRA